MTVLSEFIDSLLAALAYWREATRDMDDRAFNEVDRERQNLFRAVQFGMALPQAWELTAEVALNVIPLVNRRLYRQEWIPVLEQLITLCPADRLQMKFDLLIQCGRMQRLVEKRDIAMETLQAAETLAGQLGDQGALARAYYHIGRVHMDARRYREAERYSQLALGILDDAGTADPDLIAWTLNTLGNVYREDGNYDLANDCHSRSLVIWRAEGDQTGEARALIELASNFRDSGQLDEAITHFKEAERLLSTTANEFDKTTVGINLGFAYYVKEEYLLAVETFHRAYSAHLRKSGELRLQAILTMNLGNVLLKIERLDEAEAYIRPSIDLWKSLDDDLNLANAVGILGEILAGKGRDEEAIPFFDQAITLCEKHPLLPRANRLVALFKDEKQKAIDRLTG